MKRIETSSKQILLTIVTLFLSTVTFASHIVGGEMSYKCLGNDYYQITLRYYRDCGGVVMPPSTDIEIANSSGTIIQTHNVPKGPSSFLNVNQPGCGQPTPAICIETAEFVVDSAYLPGGLASYTIYNQECCRNNNVDNIANAWKTGATFPAYLYPSSTLGCNSSPTFGAYPPVAIPVNVPLSVPINASDVDGDSLFFQLCSPLSDATPSSPFSSVSFAPGYSSNNMVPSSPAFSIDPATGILSGTPNQLGKFAIGICVNEYRNGVLIGKVRRDYQFTVITPWSLFGTITAQTDAGCGSGGSATVTAAGSSGPYTYNWSNNATTATANNLSVGTHTVIVSNGSCSDTASVVIKGGASFTTNVTNQTTLACGATTGASATISINGGVPPYNVVWPSGPGGLTNNQLNLGANKVAVTDNANCTDTVTIMITQGGAGVTVSVDSIKATSCATAANGYVSLLGNGGAAPYTFTWSDSTTASTRTNLLLGNYGVKVTDANGCSDSVSISVPAGAGLTLSWDSIQSIGCPGGSNGYLKPLVSGGAAPYNFLWNTNASTSALGGLSSGTYILTVTDVFGCVESIAHDFLDPDSLLLSLNHIKDPSCHNAFDGAIHVGISGGIAPYDVLWNTSDTSSTLNNLPSGNYSVAVTDSRGCSLSANYTLANPDSLWLSFKTIQTISCNGGIDAAVEVEVNGGSTPYVYSWSNSVQSALNNNLSAGTYSVSVTDSAGCIASAQYIVTEPSALSIQLDSVEVAFCGLPNGAASITVTGGTAPYAVVWSNSMMGPSIAGVASGNYTAVVTDALGCQDSLQVFVPSTSNVALRVDSVFQPSCGVPNGYVEVSVGGGVAPYSYTWSNGGSSTSSSGLSSGTYTIIVKDSKDCEDSVSVNLMAATAPSISFQTTKDPTCNGNNGELSIAISGGQAPYTILWNTNDTSRALSNLAAGTYGVTVTDGNGCMVASQYTLVTPTPLVLNLDTLAAATCGNQNGMASISASGGTAPYSVTWSNSHQGNQISGLAAGTYIAYVTDSIGCIDSISVEVQNLSGFSASLDTTVLPSCFGGSDGFAKVLPQGGQAPYTFIWSNGSTSDTAMGLAAGNYHVIVQDAIGCGDSINFLLYSPNQLQVAVDTIQNPSCFGGNDGILSIDISGGNAPYNILWSTSDTVSTLNNLGSGSYGVTVTDSRGCSTTASFTLSNPDSLQIILKNQQSVSCHGGNDGAIDVSVKGGTAPYSLLWNNSQVDSSLANLTAGTYTLVLTDANGCSSQASFIITEPQALSVVVDSVSSETCGQQNGTASISVSGGTAPYSILWNTNQVTPSVQGLSAGTYNAVVTDANGCSDSVQVSVAGGGNFSLSLDSSSAPLCAGTNTGFAKVNITGGTAPFSYSWSNGSTSDTAHGLSGGFNYVLVSDALGCNDSLAVNLSSPDSLEIELQSIDHALCNGLSGSISINVKGGEAPYSINWSNNVSGQTLLNVKPGIYSVNVTDGKGCSVTATYTITEPDSFIVVVDSIKHPTCAGEGDGEVFLRASGNTGISSIVVNHGKVTSAGIIDLHAGKYSVYVLDSAGCGTSVAFEIKDPQPLVVEDVNVIAPGCDPTDFGFIELAVSGGLAPYTYKWQDGTTTLNHYNVDNGLYRLVVTDAGGCSTTRIFEFMNKDMRLFVSMEELTCASYADAEIQIAVSGAVAPFHLSLNGQEVYEGKMNLQSANYVLTLTDAEGCIVTEEFVISEQVEVKAFFATAFTPDGDGINDTYTIKGSEECFTNATMEVFNRWGAKVFETNQPFKEAWDGTVNGYIAKSDVYLYSFKSDQLTETGHFNILR
ncbi:gliding motility-associated C-terminal domain-containing protein [Owenweeksia hongkongensis]|uniref:T9SS type B sorting domain-containing protein n=1 Tax=Owenweeksia hongkongensis TaxID=253245 RepID=UPI003A943C63